MALEHTVYELRAEVMKALAHPARLMMADALSDGERCVCELQELVGTCMPTVSRHLAQMRNAGIVSARREGNQVFYSLTCPCVMRVFPCIDEVLRNERERMAEAARATEDAIAV